MTSLLSNLFNNLATGIHEIKRKHRVGKKKAKHVELNTKSVSAALNSQTLKTI